MSSCYGQVSNIRVESGLWRNVWYNGTPPKVQFFMWTAVLEKISTMDSLWRKGFYLPSICLFYYCESESASHLLINCPFSWEIWCGLTRDYGTTFIASSNLIGLIGRWTNPALSCFGKQIWRIVLAAVCWAIWNERNNRVFKG